MADHDESGLRSTIRKTRETASSAYGEASSKADLLGGRIDKFTDAVEAKEQSAWSRFRAWRDTTDPTVVLTSVFTLGVLASRPSGTLAMVRNASIATGFTSWMLYPKATAETVLEVKKFVKNGIKSLK
mmetsp:Transcript_15780/g.23771  ORF Transcript_15780/g.23771 Transcript_15780/m.23771 type:complete len:128 (-) Transcript_15780:145-528(-)